MLSNPDSRTDSRTHRVERRAGVTGHSGDAITALPAPYEQPSVPAAADAPQERTLLELVWAAGETTHEPDAVVASVVDQLESGRVRLCGNFRGAPLSTLTGELQSDETVTRETRLPGVRVSVHRGALQPG